MAEANGIRAQYLEKVQQLKDKKTRNIAIKDVSRIGDQINYLRKDVEAQDARRALGKMWTPEFAGGGFFGGGIAHQVFGAKMGYTNVLPRGFLGRVPGIFDRKDNNLLAVTGDERVIVMNPEQWNRTGHKRALSHAGAD